ncbi:MAG: hypothetical protein FD180_2450 [Planctomycetota bacterium]|nr:MAG: hypothetical protein FD180_2450 [Planctomycetota bacterium]
MKRPLAAALVFSCLLPLAAEKVNMSPEKLRETATHVVVGKVVAVYARKVEDAKWRTTHYVAEVAVADVEKGEGLAKGGLVYARYWTREWIGGGDMPPGTNGHRDCPAEGKTLRIYLARNAYDGFSDENKDGGFNVIGANGFEAIAEKK